MNVSVHGLGKLGLPLASLLAGLHERVYATDVSSDLLLTLGEGKVPFQEPGLPEQLAWARPQLIWEPNALEAARNSTVHFVVVPTPSGVNGFFTNKYVLEAVTPIAEAMRISHDYHTIVIVSTVMPGSGESDIIPYIEEVSHKRVNVGGWGYIYNPEFIALGSVLRDMTLPDFVLVGASQERAAKELETATWKMFLNDPPRQVMSVVNAEIAKLTLNTYVTMKISFANQLAEICEKVPGGNAYDIANAIGIDKRIGKRYLIPGTPYGGPCFPRDSVAFTAYANVLGVQAPLAEATEEINRRQLRRIANAVTWHGRNSKKIAILGLAYKAGTPVTEQAFGTQLFNLLLRNKYNVVPYDPILSPASWWQDADMFVICTPEPEFAAFDFGDNDVIDLWGIAQSGKIHRVGTSEFNVS